MQKAIILWILRFVSGPVHLAGPRLRYSNPARGFAVFFLAALAFATAATALHPGALKPGQGKLLGGFALVFAGVVVSLAVEFFRVRHEYDGAGVTYGSPWSAERRVAWAEVAKVEWRPIAKWLDIVPVDASKRMHFGPMLGGLAPFAQMALQQIPPNALAEQPQARIVLELMAAGHGAWLTVDARKPSEIATEFGVLQER